MRDDYYDYELPDSPSPPGSRSRPADEAWATPAGASWLDGLRDLWHWDDLAAEIGQESQARVAFVGLPGVGKSLLFNRLRGWIISGHEERPTHDTIPPQSGICLESLGLFVLADLPPHPPEGGLDGPALVPLLGEPALLVYLLDGTVGVTATDYRWVAALRAAGKPLLVVLNKCDLLDDIAAVSETARQKLGMPVIPISALTGVNVEERLLPALLDAAPRLAVPLGRELMGLRRTAARRVIRQAALFAGVLGTQPVPGLDLPFQVMVQVGVVMRVGATYGHIPTGGLNREVISVVAGTLGIRYLALTLVKFIPFVGWAVAGFLSSAMTYLIGETAIRYYEVESNESKISATTL